MSSGLSPRESRPRPCDFEPEKAQRTLAWAGEKYTRAQVGSLQQAIWGKRWLPALLLNVPVCSGWKASWWMAPCRAKALLRQPCLHRDDWEDLHWPPLDGCLAC